MANIGCYQILSSTGTIVEVKTLRKAHNWLRKFRDARESYAVYAIDRDDDRVAEIIERY